jgi:replicative DNA helicase
MIKQTDTLNLSIPYNEEAENTVIGSLIVAGECLFEVNFLEPSDFYVLSNQYIFQAILNCNNGIDQVTITHELKKLGKLDDVGGNKKLDELKQSVFTSVLIKECGKIVKDLSIARKAITLGHNIQAIGYHETDPTKLISRIEQMFLKLQENMAVPRLIAPKELAEKSRDRYNELSQGKKLGLLTGFRDIDYNTGGLYPGEYWIVGARPSIGKTTFLMDIVRNITSQQKKNVLMVSLEQGWEEIIDREMAHFTQKNPVEIRSGGWDDDLAELIALHVGEMSKSTLYFYDAGSLMAYESATTNSIFGVASHMKLAYGIDLIVLDYIGLIEDEVGRGGNDNERISYISRRIKKMARNLQVPVLCACQLSRGVEHMVDRRPKLSDLRSSGALEQDADLVGFLYRDDYYPDITEQKKQNGEIVEGKAEFTISKQRTGGKGMEFQIPLVWDKFHRCYRDAYRGQISG